MGSILYSSEGHNPSATNALAFKASAQESLDWLGELHAKQTIIAAPEKTFNPSCRYTISQTFTLKVLNNASSYCVLDPSELLIDQSHLSIWFWDFAWVACFCLKFWICLPNSYSWCKSLPLCYCLWNIHFLFTCGVSQLLPKLWKEPFLRSSLSLMGVSTQLSNAVLFIFYGSRKKQSQEGVHTMLAETVFQPHTPHAPLSGANCDSGPPTPS